MTSHTTTHGVEMAAIIRVLVLRAVHVPTCCYGGRRLRRQPSAKKLQGTIGFDHYVRQIVTRGRRVSRCEGGAALIRGTVRRWCRDDLIVRKILHVDQLVIEPGRRLYPVLLSIFADGRVRLFIGVDYVAGDQVLPPIDTNVASAGNGLVARGVVVVKPRAWLLAITIYRQWRAGLGVRDQNH